MTPHEAERATRVLEWLGLTHQGFWDRGMRRDYEATMTLLEQIVVKGTKDANRS